MSPSRVLVSTAHPDDETLWAGGYLLQNPGTHVACCCIDRRNHERTERFFVACAALKAVPFVVAGDFDMWGLDTRPISAFAASYDSIITHNEIGEYGHPAHIKLHHAMRALKKPMRVFNYGLTLGQPIDLEAKLEILKCYRDPNLLPWLDQFKFDLGREELIDRS